MRTTTREHQREPGDPNVAAMPTSVIIAVCRATAYLVKGLDHTDHD